MFPRMDLLILTRIADSWMAFFLPVMLKSSLLMGLLLLAGRLMRSASASARHLMWALGMSGLLLLPILQAGLPSWQVVPMPGPLAMHTGDLAPGSGRSVPATLGGAGEPVAAELMREPGFGSDVAAAPALDARASARPRTAGPFDTLRDFLASVPSTDWGLLLWLSGMLPLVLALTWGMARLRRFQREARALANDRWPELLRSLCRDLGIDAPPQLLISPRAIAPMSWGLRRPVVLLPRDCHEWPVELRRQVLLHELAHVRRRDCLTQLAAQCACLLHWFNPLVWAAAGRMRVERERACDDLVLVEGALPSVYANHLLQIACEFGARERSLSVGLAMARRSRIFDRLDAVLDSRRHRSSPGRRAVTLAAGLLLACVTALSMLGPMAQAQQEESAQSTVRGELPTSATPNLPEMPPLPGLPELSLSTLDLFASGRSGSWEYEAHGVNVRMEMKGRIEFKDDYTGIIRLDKDAAFTIEEKRGRRKTRLQVEPGDGGQPVYHHRVGRDSRPFDAEGAAWLARTIDFLMLEAGIDADVRVRRVYEREGFLSVLALIKRVESEHAQGIYYAEVFGLDNLRDDEIIEVFQRVQRDLKSDYTRACILIAYVDHHLGRAATREAFHSCLSSVKSDYEMCRVLQSGLDRQNRTPEELAVLLAEVYDIESDYEAAQVLSAFHPDQLADEGTRRAYFAALDGLESDYEKAGVLISLARRAEDDTPLRKACLAAAERIQSPYEYSRVVQALR